MNSADARDKEVVKIMQEYLQIKDLQEMLDCLREFDVSTYDHSWRVGRNCRDISLMLGLHYDAMTLLVAAGVFHDIGKISLPEDIVKKNGGLTSEEKKTMDTHGAAGFRLLGGYNLELARLVLMHHYDDLVIEGLSDTLPYWPEEIDVSKNPDLKPCTMSDQNTGILLFPLLVIADHFDALASPRHYKESWNAEKIWRHLSRKFPKHKPIVRMLLEKYCSPLNFSFE